MTTSPLLPAYPDFPTDASLPEAALARLPLSRLLARDAATEHELFAICQSHGFFYLDLTESDAGAALLALAERLHALARAAFRLPPAAKQAIHQSRSNTIFGWKAAGAVAAADAHRRADVGEFFNVSKDDLLDLPHAPGIAYPPPLADARPELAAFASAAHATGLLVLRALAAQLGLDPGAMDERHQLAQQSGDHVRLTWGPGSSESPAALQQRSEAATRVNVFGHTDFGSVTLLFNWLGGLQMADPASPHEERWLWVRPRPGHAIVNLGDAAVVFSGGRLRSGLHRVVDAPGAQARLERHSVVYFVRPTDGTRMLDLTAKGEAGPGCTAGEWIRRRVVAMGNPITRDA